MNLSWRMVQVWSEKLRRVWYLTDRVHLGLIAAGVAFYASLSIFPGIAALIALFGLMADPAVVETELQLLREVIPDDAYVLLADQVTRLLQAGRLTLGWTTALSVGIALWSARAGVGALIEGLNAIYGIPNRGGLWHMAFSLILTLVLIAMAIAAMLVVFVAPILIAYLPLSADMTGWLSLLRWITALVLMLGGLALVYRFGPNRRLRRSVFMTWGAVAVIALWLGASAGLSFYMSNFPSYNEVYGSIGAVVALMLWMYVSAYLVLLGAALNAVREGHGRMGARARRDHG
jgi:membrane protein